MTSSVGMSWSVRLFKAYIAAARASSIGTLVYRAFTSKQNISVPSGRGCFTFCILFKKSIVSLTNDGIDFTWPRNWSSTSYGLATGLQQFPPFSQSSGFYHSQ
ncbi:hypothetical protein DPMN_038120 [Dreissena polymorpha]|uniref:Uncharacterized protein n=1 Tax=Dreissena polymorpha TaxID=45954 RepID=A0A9D4MEN2_DREPO|nr:hypothetical protein DPMN_038120 [Dreissena polymorpha]